MPKRKKKTDIEDARHWVKVNISSPLDRRKILLAALDAYDAQRPRPASEPPGGPCRVLLRRRRGSREWVAGSYHPVGIVSAETRWAIYGGPLLTDAEVLAWLPQPEVDDD